MAKNINSDLIRGNINTIILKSLYSGDRYGYDIIREIEEKSHGQYILKQPTLYSCLKRLESQGFISSYWGEQSNGGRRKYYSLTDMGREVFIKNQDEYEFSRTVIDQLISERDYDLDSVEPAVRDEEIPEVDAEDEIDLDISNPPERVDAEITAEETTATEIFEETAPKEQIDETVACDNIPSSAINETTTTAQASHSTTIDEMLEENETATTYFGTITSSDTTAASPLSFNPGNAPQQSDDYVDIFPSDSAELSALDTYLSDLEQTDAAQQEQISNPAHSEAPQTSAQPTTQQSTTTTEFLSYDTANIPVDTTPTPQASDSYRSTLSSLFSGQTDTVQTQATEPPTVHPKRPERSEVIARSSLAVNENIEVRSFGRFRENMREMCEEVKIRTHDTNAVREYNRQYYYYSNKLLLFEYAILFLVMILETFLTYIIVKNGLGIHTQHDISIYTCSILFCLAFPVYAGITFWTNPYKKKRIDFSLRSSLFFRIIIMLQVVLIVYAVNVYAGMPLGGSIEHVLYLSIPIVLSTNIPASAIIFNRLYKSKKFAIE